MKEQILPKPKTLLQKKKNQLLKENQIVHPGSFSAAETHLLGGGGGGSVFFKHIYTFLASCGI